ncbi:MAG: restriction endonuclease subunit S, partial [Thermodesulfovibrionales bacterium]|nr:restriction endonuclease subunit S [Thermodesulfovibrionales bacterium]
GICDDQLSLRFEDFKKIFSPNPPLQEQNQIARFLDYKTSLISRFIRAKRRLIELLKEQKQVIINDAVTGKIDVATGKPYPKYKDSGVQWLGQVPEGWEVLPLKRITQFAYGDSLPNEKRLEGTIPVYGSNGIVGRHTVSNTKSKVIIIGRKGSYGKLNFSDVPSFVIDTAFYIDETYTKLPLKWLFYALSVLELDKQSKDAAVPGLSRDDAYKKLLAVPALYEQTQIVSYIESKTSAIDDAISKYEREIALMQEYRTRLISDVVTGKVDVRDIEVPDIEGIDDIIDDPTNETEVDEELQTEEDKG